MMTLVSKLPLIYEFKLKFSQDRNAATYHLMDVMKIFYVVTLIGLLDVPIEFEEHDTISLYLFSQYGYILPNSRALREN